MPKFFIQIVSDQCNKYSTIIEDDGIVCYAYLLSEKLIIGDVWLYNQSSTPTITDWTKNNLPFLNPTEFVEEKILISPLTSEINTKLEWHFSEDCNLEKVEIFIRGHLIAIMEPGSKPGWSINVKKNGPLAKILRNE